MRCCFITLGCRVNQYESDAMAELLTQAGFEITENPSEADVCIVNTCTVTNIADRKSRQMLSKAHKLNPNAKLIAAGCFAQRSPEAAAKLEGVYAVLGSADKKPRCRTCKSIAEGRENESKSRKMQLRRKRIVRLLRRYEKIRTTRKLGMQRERSRRNKNPCQRCYA